MQLFGLAFKPQTGLGFRSDDFLLVHNSPSQLQLSTPYACLCKQKPVSIGRMNEMNQLKERLREKVGSESVFSFS